MYISFIVFSLTNSIKKILKRYKYKQKHAEWKIKSASLNWNMLFVLNTYQLFGLPPMGLMLITSMTCDMVRKPPKGVDIKQIFYIHVCMHCEHVVPDRCLFVDELFQLTCFKLLFQSSENHRWWNEHHSARNIGIL